MFENKNVTDTNSNIGLVSVIIPNYNHADFLGDAIDSVLQQTYSPVEVLVIDDGSVDHSRQVAETYGEQIRYIYQENQGLSAARNTGLRAAMGEFIGVLDADDIYEPNFLSQLVSLLQNDPDAAAVYCGYQFVNDHNQPLHQVEARSVPSADLFQALAQGNFLVPESILVRKTHYNAVGFFDTTLRACEDMDMWMRIAKQYKVINTPQVLIRHRVLAGSMSTNPERMYTNRFKVLGKHFTDTNAPNAKKAYAYGHLTSSIEYLQDGDEEESYQQWRRMAEIDPSILLDFSALYELGCGPQPKGSRGQFASIDFKSGEKRMVTFLNRLFTEPSLKKPLGQRKSQVYAMAYSVLAFLAYGGRQFGQTHRFMYKAVRYDSQILDARLRTMWLKAAIGILIPKSLRKNL